MVKIKNANYRVNSVIRKNIIMGGKKLESRHIRKLCRVGGGKTYSITIPVEIIREFRWLEKQKLVVKKYGEEKIIIEDWKK